MRLAREMRLTLDGPPPTVGGSRRSNRSCITTVLNPGATAGQIVSEVRVAMLGRYAAPPTSPTQRKGCAVQPSTPDCRKAMLTSSAMLAAEPATMPYGRS